jgi:hypothetical protein
MLLYVKNFPDEIMKKLDEEAAKERRSRPAQLIRLLEVHFGMLPENEEKTQEANA